MRNKKNNYKKITLFWVIVFLVGGFSGVIFDNLFIPWLTNFYPLNKISWLAGMKNGTTIINKSEKIYVARETAFQDAVNKLSGSAVAVRIERAGRLPIENSGFILTNDGLIATADFVLASDAKILVSRENKEYEADLIKRDKANNFALIKIADNNLPIVEFADDADLRLGEEVFLLGVAKTNGIFSKFINFGFIKTLTPEMTFTFTESALADGAPLGNVEGKVMGLVLVDGNGVIRLIGADMIKELLKSDHTVF